MSDDAFQLEKLVKDEIELLVVKKDNCEFVFSTGKAGLDFSLANEKGAENISKMKDVFGLSEIGYLKQVHGDLILQADGTVRQGDALYACGRMRAAGVFTADCVPVLVADAHGRVIAAVHSGWKGTCQLIVLKTIKKLMEQFHMEPEELNVVIGPHIMQCCYEVSQEIIEKFQSMEEFRGVKISEGRMLSLKACILQQLKLSGVKPENVKSLDICTHCNEEYEMHSFRRNKTACRQFSFVFSKI